VIVELQGSPEARQEGGGDNAGIVALYAFIRFRVEIVACKVRSTSIVGNS